jgi:peptidoglycan/LPS O-acetylase OafA/YrhL
MASPEPNSHLNNFDLVRLLAAFQVLFNHAVGWLQLPNAPYPYSVLISCFPGVPIFFVVSGFLVTRSFFDTRGKILVFAWRRALRIYPGLWANLTVILILLAAVGTLPVSNFSHAAFWRWALAFYVTASDLGAIVTRGRVTYDWTHFYGTFPSGVLWTITVELAFYALVPVVFAVYNRRRLTWAIIACATLLSLMSVWFLMDWRTTASDALATAVLLYSPAPYFWVFLIGAAIAYSWTSLRQAFVNKALLWAAAYGFLCWADNTYFGNLGIDLIALKGLMVPRMIVLGCLVISFAYTIPWLSRPLRGIDLSFGIYLYHMLFISTLHFAGLREASWLWLVVIISSVLTAAGSWFLVERPALRLKKKPPRFAASLFPARPRSPTRFREEAS